MASASSAPLAERPLMIRHQQRIRSLTSRSWKKNLEHTWSRTNASRDLRFPFLHHSRSSPLRSSFSLCPSLRLPNPPLCPLFGPRLSPFWPSLPLMTTTTPGAAADSDAPPSSPTKTVKSIIKGRVQGVFYRNWTIENATELELKGWVRNRKDGSVEALFSGKADAVQEMEQRCCRGPPAAMVTAIEVVPSDEDPGTGFELRPTV